MIAPLKRHEVGVDPAFRPGFRAGLPYYRLLDASQQEQLRGLFAHLLPAAAVTVTDYSRDEKVELDLLAETYVGQARAFAELMAQYEFDIAHQTRRDAKGVITALSLSGSIFFLGHPSPTLERSYRYTNIYGNRKVEPTGSCVVKSHPCVGHRLRTDQFRSTTLLLLAVHPSDVADGEDLASLSQSIHTGISSRMAEISRVARDLVGEAERGSRNESVPADQASAAMPPRELDLATGALEISDVRAWSRGEPPADGDG